MASEKRLIDANALMDAFRGYMVERYDNEKCVSEENCKTCENSCLWRKIVSVAPTVDAVEVVHAKWEIEEFPITGCKKITCSRCRYREDRGPAWNKNWGFHHYCPNCGAKMDGGNEDAGFN